MSLLFNRLIASFSPWAIRLENRKKLKATTSKTSRLRTTSGPASQAEVPSRLRWPGAVRERPTKTAIVKRELTLTRPSRAVTWMLVVDGGGIREVEGPAPASLLWRSGELRRDWRI
ncbi:hypothetical protein DsansV1_C08g0081421 [Dioscorea sansibarensis]